VLTGKPYLNPNSVDVKSSHTGMDKCCPTLKIKTARMNFRAVVFSNFV
jgi:hypothetical protein